MLRLLMICFCSAIAAPLAPANADFEGGGARTPDGGAFGARPWDLAVTVSAGFNDNVVLAPEDTFFDGDRESAFLAAAIRGRCRIPLRGPWDLTVSGELSHIAYFDDRPLSPVQDSDLTSYDVTVLSPQINLSRRARIFNRPGQVRVGYGFRREWADIEAVGLESHQVNLSVSMKPSPKTTIAATASVAVNAYDVEFPDPALDDRDGERYALGVSVTQAIGDDGARAVLSYGYQRNDTDGTNFAYDGHVVSARLEAPLRSRLWVAGEVSADFRDYDGFESGFVAPPGREEQTVYGLSAEAIYQVSSQVALRAAVSHRSFDSNSAQFEADQTIAVLSLRYSF